MGQIVDARGLACPQPVVRTRAALEAGEAEVVTIVDNETAARNVARMATKAGWSADVRQDTDGIYVQLTRDTIEARPATEPATDSPAWPPVLLIKSDRVGSGDDELGGILMRAFLHTIAELDEPPAAVIFLNSGVKLTVEGSPVLEDLCALEEAGVELLACGTCLNFFGITAQLRVGTVSNMYTIVETLMAARKIITP
jgi:selenium metabolism protein YedF